ncbi:hypothetical protein M8J75_016599 [Diaphorina citri]|nr:hypothetical protein M8J75_016599 [Diaphorina citri]
MGSNPRYGACCLIAGTVVGSGSGDRRLRAGYRIILRTGNVILRTGTLWCLLLIAGTLVASGSGHRRMLDVFLSDVLDQVDEEKISSGSGLDSEVLNGLRVS